MVTLDLKKLALPVLKTNTYKLLYSASLALDFDAHFSLTSVACAVGPSFTTFSTGFLFQNLVF
jgi:hypothetical protein